MDETVHFLAVLRELAFNPAKTSRWPGAHFPGFGDRVPSRNADRAGRYVDAELQLAFELVETVANRIEIDSSCSVPFRVMVRLSLQASPVPLRDQLLGRYLTRLQSHRHAVGPNDLGDGSLPQRFDPAQDLLTRSAVEVPDEADQKGDADESANQDNS